MKLTREESAERTRRAIVASARRLFARNGFAGTTVREIAREAGVSPQTIYDSVGSKAAILTVMNDTITEEAEVAKRYAELAIETDPAALLAIPVRVCRDIIDRCGDIVRAATAASETEPELGALRDEGTRRLKAGCAVLTDKLVELGAVDAGRDRARLADTIATFCDTAVWLVWIDDYGWEIEDAERFATETLERLILDR